MNVGAWWIIIGLFLDLAGAMLLASALIPDRTRLEHVKKEAAAPVHERHNQSVRPKDFLRHYRNATWGVGFLCLGYVFQIVGTYLAMT